MENLRIYDREKEELIEKVRALVYAEAEKSPKEMDDSFVSECVDFLMELEGRQALNEKTIEQNVARILGRMNKKHISFRRLLIAACVAIILFILFMVSPMATDAGIFDIPEVKYNDIISKMLVGESRYFDGYEIIRESNPVRYKSVEKFLKKEKKDAVLYPEVFPDGESVARIHYHPELSSGESLSYGPDNGTSRVTVYFNSGLPEGIYESGLIPENIAGFECYILDEEDMEFVLCDFEHNGSRYHVTSDSYENIVLIIENLKEIKRE